MPCIDQRNRMQDKNADWDRAIVDREEATRNRNAAATGIFLACGAIVISLGTAGPLCLAAISADVYAEIQLRTAVDKENIAANESLQAIADYGKCLAKSNRTSES